MGPGGPGPWVSGSSQSANNSGIGGRNHNFMINGKTTQVSQGDEHLDQLVDSLKKININELDQQEQEKLKFLSD